MTTTAGAMLQPRPLNLIAIVVGTLAWETTLITAQLGVVDPLGARRALQRTSGMVPVRLVRRRGEKRSLPARS